MIDIKNTNITPWQMSMVGVALCALVTFGAYWYGVKPLIERNNVLQQQQANLSAEQQKTHEASTKLAKLKQLKSELEEHIQDSALQLKSGHYLNQQVAALSKLARESKLDVNGLQPGEFRFSEHYQTISIRVDGKGKFVDIVNFLTLIHAKYPDTMVYEFDLTGQPEVLDVPLTFRFSLNWHATPEAKAVAAR